MAPEYHYVLISDSSDTTLSNVVRHGALALAEQGEMGAPATSGLWLDDKNAAYDFLGNQRFYIKEPNCAAQATLSGTVAKAAGSTTITGTGTSFTTEVTAGRELVVPGGGATEYLFVDSITDDTHLEVFNPAKYTASGQTGILAAKQVMFYGVIGVQRTERGLDTDGGGYVVGAGRRWNIDLIDPNTVLHYRIERTSTANRAAETVKLRMEWLLASSVVASLIYDEGMVDYPATKVDKADLRGRFVDDIINEMAVAAGYNFALYYHEYTGHLALWFRKNEKFGYASALRFSNTKADIVAGTHKPVFADNMLQRDPRRIVSGVRVNYKGGSQYVSDATIAATFDYRDAVASNANIKKATTATTYGQRFLTENRTQDEKLRIRAVLSDTEVNDAKVLQQVRVKLQHQPGWSTERWGRIVNRQIIQKSPRRYHAVFDLVPVNALATCASATDLNHLHGTVTAGVVLDQGNVTWAFGCIPGWFGIIPLDQPVSNITVANPSYANDADVNTKSVCVQQVVRGNGQVSLYWQSDLGAAYDVCSMKGTNAVGSNSWQSRAPDRIEYSADGVSWTTVPGHITYTNPGSTPQYWILNFDATVNARYWRIRYVFVSPNPLQICSLWNFNVLGTNVYDWQILGI